MGRNGEDKNRKKSDKNGRFSKIFVFPAYDFRSLNKNIGYVTQYNPL